jgi:hypothetical protein
MKCFGHPNFDAVGICANCGRGVCGECATPIASQQLSCSEVCAERLSNKLQVSEKVNAWAMTTTAQSAEAGRTWGGLMMGFGLLLVGLAAVLYWQHGADSWPMIAFLALCGPLTFWMGIACWQQGNWQKNVANSDPWNSRIK